MDVLQHHAELPAQRGELPLPHVETLDEHAATRHVVKPHEQTRQGRLARTGVPDDCYRLARTNGEIDVLEHPVLVRIGEPDVVEAETSVGAFRQLRVGRRRDGDLGIEKLEYPLRRRHRALEDVELLREIADGAEELLRILHESDEPAQSECAQKNLPASVPDDERDRDGAQDLDRRIEEGIVQDGFEVGLGVLSVELAVLAKLPRFLPEELNHLHADDVLLDESVEHRDPCADPAIYHTHPPLEDERHGKERGKHGEGHQGETPVQIDQHHHDAEEHEDVAEYRNDARREELVQRVDVGRNASDEPPHRVSIEKAWMELLQMAEDLPSHVVHDSLTRHVHDVDLAVGDDKLEHQGQNVYSRERVETGHIAVRDVIVDGDLGQKWPDELESRDGDYEKQRDDDGELVGLQVAKQTPHQAAVIYLAERVLLVMCLTHA